MSVGAVNKNTGDRIPTAGNPLDKVGNLASLHTTAKNDAVSAINEVKDEVSAIKDGTAIDSFADVENALADKTDDDDVAPEFNDTTAYSTGELVYKNGQLYKFDSDHAAGAWDSSEVSPTTVAAEFNQLKNTLIDVDRKIDDATEYPYAPSITIEDAVPANLAECKVKIEPVQSGSGDPSPTNIRPITGHTEASVEVTDGDDTTKIYTIALGDTIYGGTVDFNTGVMTVDMAIVDFDGSDVWRSSQTSGRYIYSVADGKLGEEAFEYVETSHYPYGASEDDDVFWCDNSGSQLRIIFNTSFATKEDWLSYLTTQNTNGTPLQICYPLATPTTIQLTPQQIQLLKGTNTLTASTGDISVTVNGVSGAIGQVQEQVNDHEERIGAVESGLIDLTSSTTTALLEGTMSQSGTCYYVQIGKVVFVNANLTKTTSSWILVTNLPIPKISACVGVILDDNGVIKYPVEIIYSDGMGKLRVRTSDVFSNCAIAFSYIAM